ncbi:MAG TPA: ATP-binding cassette domain-containing protein [Nitrospinota bacterium]|nr:ATP-binding cassette domain-containing protein [Nitrospinota bacterium]
MNKFILEARNLTYEYNAASVIESLGVRPQALSGVSLMIKRGSKVAILGGNGAGKSTLTMHFNGMYKPTSGELLLDGKPADYSRKARLDWMQRVGMVLQDPDDQIFSATVFKDVSFGPMNLGLPEDQVKIRVTEALEEIDISFLAEMPTHMLSFGQRKKVAIAGVVAMRPEVLVLDEPTAGLDPSGVDQLLNILARLHARGATLIITTHDVDLAYGWADEVIIMKDGQVVRQGEPNEVMSDIPMMESASLRQPWPLAMGQALEENLACLRIKRKANEPNSLGDFIKAINTKSRLPV